MKPAIMEHGSLSLIHICNYGERTTYQEFDKMACCDAICGMEVEIQQKVLCHLKTVVEKLIKLYNEVDP